MGAAIPILYADEHLLVVNKPSGLLSVATPNARGRTLPEVLGEQGYEVHPVHRLDREVSGAILFAREPDAATALGNLFRERAIRKTYWALVRGKPAKAAADLKFPILEERGRARVSARGKPSHTHYRTLREHPRATEVEVELHTGRYNQIRVHLAHAGSPLIGETKYARRKEDPLRFARVALHAWRLAFDHPVGGAPVSVEAPLAEDLERLVEDAGAGGKE